MFPESFGESLVRLKHCCLAALLQFVRRQKTPPRTQVSNQLLGLCICASDLQV